MFPLRDSTPSRSFPFINYLIILINFLVFFIQLDAPDFERFVFEYGFVPVKYTPFDPSFYKYAFFSIWMHGGWFHIISNMWFLHIFGDNVEDRIGHFSYLLFYIFSGFAAVFLQYFVNMESVLPMIGASGAVSGVAGIYFVLFRDSRIKTLVMGFFGFVQIIELPVWFFLGYWFFIQVFSGLGSLVAYDMNQGGVAWFAHIGGFLWGYYVGRKMQVKMGLG